MAGDAGKAAPDERTAAVMWLGYDAPDAIPAAVGDGSAGGAVADLSRFQTGLRTTHEGPASHHTVLGHSYGSTAIGHTALRSGVDADALIFVGSPGVDADHAGDLTGDVAGVPPGQVWATRAEHDIIRRVPEWNWLHGTDPTRGDFGARVFTSDSGDPGNEFATHSAYWDPDNAARRNIAYIVTGQGGQVR
jgi:pimeloyl-ACP methyl ester carboxylesterase